MAMPTDIGIVDLGIGFPYTSVEQKKHTYDFFRANLKDTQSQQEMEFPAQYMFKGVPDVVDEGTDVVEWMLDKMDAVRHRDRQGRPERRTALEAQQPYPDRFVLGMSVNPNDGLDALRKMEEAKAEHDIVSTRWSSRRDCVPQVGIDNKLMYPVYIKCVELDIPMCINGGIVGPRMPSWPQ